MFYVSAFCMAWDRLNNAESTRTFSVATVLYFKLFQWLWQFVAFPAILSDYYYTHVKQNLRNSYSAMYIVYFTDSINLLHIFLDKQKCYGGGEWIGRWS